MTRQSLRSGLAALMLLAPVAASFAAQPAPSQARADAAQPAITNVSLNSDAGLSPGASLRVQVRAAPNGRQASVTLGDSGVTVPLHEDAPGTYTGNYVVRRKDQIDPMQLMTARVSIGDRSYSRQFHFPPGFQALAMGAGPQATVRAERDEHVARNDDRAEERMERRDGDRYAANGSLPLQVTSHGRRAFFDGDGNLAIDGRTAPFANVRVQVEEVAGPGGMTQAITDQTVQADGDGRFGVVVAPRDAEGAARRYEVRVTASNGGQAAEERLTLFQRQG